MHRHQTIIISGKQKSGKSTLSNYLQRYLSRFPAFSVRDFIFAEPIYAIHNHSLAILKDHGIRPIHDPKDGPWLQTIGDWIRGTQGEDSLVVSCVDRVEKFHTMAELEKQKSIAVISDCRKKNEFHTFANALTVRLECDREIRKSRAGDTWRDNENHITETDLDSYVTEGKFKMIFDTEKDSPEHITNLIIAQILKLEF